MHVHTESYRKLQVVTSDDDDDLKLHIEGSFLLLFISDDDNDTGTGGDDAFSSANMYGRHRRKSRPWVSSSWATKSHCRLVLPLSSMILLHIAKQTV